MEKLKAFFNKTLLIYLAFAISSAFITFAIYTYKPYAIELFDLRATDIMFRLRGDRTPPKEVVIVAIDEKSINKIGRWPWKRAVIADLVTKLKPAKVVAFDMVFSESEDKYNDDALSRAVKDADNVVLGYFFRNDSTEKPKKDVIKMMDKSKLSALRFLDGVEVPFKEIGFLEFKDIEPNIAHISKSADNFGSFNIQHDADGVYRHIHLVYSFKEKVYPVLSVEALKKYYEDDFVISVSSQYGIDSMNIGRNTIPLDKEAAIALNYYGPGATFKTIPAIDIINGVTPVEEYKDKIIYIGVTEKAVYDIRVTPVDSLYPGVEVHATITGNILDKNFLLKDEIVTFVNWLMIFFLPILLALSISRIHKTYLSLIVFSIFMIISFNTSYFLFASNNSVVTVVYPFMSLLLSYFSIEAYRNFVVDKDSRFAKKALSTYVSSHVVNELMKNPDMLKLGGEKRVITILFSDIRGFTSISEKMTPERLVTILNEYLTPMTDIVLEANATLDKYIGDAIMAIFNAPMDMEDHEGRACQVCLDMILKLIELNRDWSDRGLDPMHIGIGLHTGEAIVGNMGSLQKFDYTAIGDTVNLSSRLEGMTKLYGVNIIVSETTYQSTRNDYIFRELDIVRVKGKEKPIGIFELIDSNNNLTAWAPLLDGFIKGTNLYRRMQFKEAAIKFQDVLKKYPGDGPSKVYLNRCREFLISPPAANWDGVYIATSK